MSETETDNWPVRTGSGAPEPEALRDIMALVAAAFDTDGNPPLSEQTLVELASPAAEADALLTLLAYAPEEKSDPSTGQDLAGLAVVSPVGGSGVLEIVVHPNYRNQGVGTLLVDKLKANRGLAGIKAWSHGDHEAAADLAARYGYVAVRELWRMRLIRTHGSDQALPEAVLPPGVTLRTFMPGQDEHAWLAANAAAFAHHPEQGSMTLSDLQARMTERWFDPAGFFLATDAEGTILGFHWTKVHPETGHHPSLGEVYVVGVTPQAQGSGLGRTLSTAGIRYLQGRGLSAIMLYVDADNQAAVSLYRSLGFTRWDADVMYGPRPE
ncbi:MAG: mycothiol synthase [Actinomycetota bacterium]|uniref:mycothiol synthase n=1 Tax=Paenarthrobacter sp. PH39-S1 TaxID=3046204 RepID=UPI0024B908C6|nr:mycothiol synthase [Paenarthrobacter sp. PH39-S1]MDJ0355926.1 mycothiol synthase [Paenarthrobacter sp. PH39-S1]MDQ6740184.1 mycothiol synthase [Actinomycetota bacterium]